MLVRVHLACRCRARYHQVDVHAVVALYRLVRGGCALLHCRRSRRRRRRRFGCTRRHKRPFSFVFVVVAVAVAEIKVEVDVKGLGACQAVVVGRRSQVVVVVVINANALTLIIMMMMMMMMMRMSRRLAQVEVEIDVEVLGLVGVLRRRLSMNNTALVSIFLLLTAQVEVQIDVEILGRRGGRRLRIVALEYNHAGRLLIHVLLGAFDQALGGRGRRVVVVALLFTCSGCNCAARGRRRRCFGCFGGRWLLLLLLLCVDVVKPAGVEMLVEVAEHSLLVFGKAEAVRGVLEALGYDLALRRADHLAVGIDGHVERDRRREYGIIVVVV